MRLHATFSWAILFFASCIDAWLWQHQQHHTRIITTNNLGWNERRSTPHFGRLTCSKTSSAAVTISPQSTGSLKSGASACSILRNKPTQLSATTATQLHYASFSDEFQDDSNDADDDEYEEDEDVRLSVESDWIQAELTLMNLPEEPDPELSAEQVALAFCRSLQWVDYPTKSAGLEWCYEFATFECRKAVTARQGGASVDRFCHYGLLSPALQPFMGANRIELGEATYTQAQPPLRGALASFPVVIYAADILTLQHPSGMVRQAVAAQPPTTNMVLRLEQQRRPPNQGCWLVREVLDVRHAFAGDMGNVHVGG